MRVIICVVLFLGVVASHEASRSNIVTILTLLTAILFDYHISLHAATLSCLMLVFCIIVDIRLVRSFLTLCGSAYR